MGQTVAQNGGHLIQQAGKFLLGDLLQQHGGLQQSQLVPPLQSCDQLICLLAAGLSRLAAPLQQFYPPAQQPLALQGSPADSRRILVREMGGQPAFCLRRRNGDQVQLLTPGAHRLEQAAAIFRQQEKTA